MGDQCLSCGSKAVVDLCLTCHWTGPERATVADSDFVLVRRSDLAQAVDLLEQLIEAVMAEFGRSTTDAADERMDRLRAALAADQYKDLAVALEARSGVLSIEGAYRCAAVALGVQP